MITDTYNREAVDYFADNGVIDQGVLSKRLIYIANQVSNNNQAPVAPSSSYTSQDTKPVTSISKNLDQDDNPITQECVSDGLGALFGAATGLDGIEMFIDYACDAAEFYDEFMIDRFGNQIVAPEQQIDPRLWLQPMPGMGMAA